MKLILALPVAGLIFSGLTFHPKTELSTPSTPEPAPRVSAGPTLWVEKSDCYRNEVIQLHFSLPHPTTMGVMDPDGHFFYLVFPQENTVGKLTPLVNSDAFEQMETLFINPATLKADPYIYGVTENQPVFTKSGVYRFILGDNLHVDDESDLNIVRVNYRHRNSPAVSGMIKN